MKDEQIWRDFYDAAIVFRDLQPWLWMHDGDLFGVEDPETGQTNYCCIMGNAKEVFALGYYLGEEGFKSYLLLANQPEELTPVDRMALGLSQLMLKVEYVDRQAMDKPDLDQLKALGLQFRGKKQWIQARDVKPGMVPMPINAQQARTLTTGLQQAKEVAARCRQDKEMLGDDEHFLVRRKMNGNWEDHYQPIQSIEVVPFTVAFPDPKRVKDARRRFAKEPTAWLFIYEYLTMPVRDDSGKGYYFPKICLWVNYADGLINNLQLIGPGEEEKSIEDIFFRQLEQTGFRPAQIGVNSIMGYRAIREFCEPLDIELMFIPDEPLFDEVMSSLKGYMSS